MDAIGALLLSMKPPPGVRHCLESVVKNEKSVEKEYKSDSEHVKRLRVTLGFTVESREVVSGGTVRTLNQMCLRLSHGVGFRNTHLFESLVVTTVGVCENALDIRSNSLDFSVNLAGCRQTFT